MTTLVFFAASAIFFVLGFTLTGALSAAEIEFTRINACRDISEVLSSLRKTSGNCGPPRGFLEKSIHDFAAGSKAQLCFMENPPVTSLSGFRCIHSSFEGARAIACYHSVPSQRLSEYRLNFDKKYAARTSSYIEDAKKCPGSNGDASRIVDTTFPPLLMAIAEHEFGFQVQYGDTRPGTSMVSHGFARTSPAVAQGGPSAIEYVVFSSGASVGVAPRIPLGKWRLQVDTSLDSAADIIKELKRQGLNAYLAWWDVDIERAPHAPALPKIPSLSAELSDVVVSRWEDEGFEEVNDEDLQEQTGKTREEMTETMLKVIPFGAPKMHDGWVPKFRILMKTSGLPCTRDGQGAIGAYLFTSEGQKNVQVDFGSVTAMVLGFGSCASSGNAGAKYVRNLAEESKQAILDDLEAR